MLKDTIAALATAPGRGGIGVIRISGPKAIDIAEKTLGFTPKPRYAHHCAFRDTDKTLLDEGIALFFPGPNSFTGEDVLELQGHGGSVIQDIILEHVINAGARMANPGEFSERAFLNDKLDLAQAEAIADLIDASSKQAVKQALNSLQGSFSASIHELIESLIHLRIYVEAAIDFPEEEIDFLSDGKVGNDLIKIQDRLNLVYHNAKQGSIIREGMKVVIAGRPNAGKSSLLNALSNKEVAIVTDIAGTTRDVLKEHIHIDGMPIHIIDTAGIRSSPDTVERIGIERAWAEIEDADQVLLIIDTTQLTQTFPEKEWPEFFENEKLKHKITIVFNKIDESSFELGDSSTGIAISAKTGAGLPELRQHLKSKMGLDSTTEGGFSARRRHLEALTNAQQALLNGQVQLEQHAAGELLAEDLRLAQDYLGEITGQLTPDDLLGKIFSSFCIGK